MTEPVDLTDFRTMTGGDRDVELALFEEFFASSEAGIGTLEAHCADGPGAAWPAAAHAFKGGAYTIGANSLGDLCKKAQEDPAANGRAKRALLDAIKAEYALVRDFLRRVHP